MQDTSVIEHGSSAYTVDNPLAKALKITGVVGATQTCLTGSKPCFPLPQLFNPTKTNVSLKVCMHAKFMHMNGLVKTCKSFKQCIL